MKLKLKQNEVISLSHGNYFDMSLYKYVMPSFLHPEPVPVRAQLYVIVDSQKKKMKLHRSFLEGANINVTCDFSGSKMKGDFVVKSIEHAEEYTEAELESTGEVVFIQDVPKCDCVTVKSYAEVTTSHDADSLDYVSVNGVRFYRGGD